MIGYKNLPPGRTGNQLLQYNFLRQIAQKLNLPFFHPQLPNVQFFENFTKKPIPFLKKWKKNFYLSSKEIIKNPIKTLDRIVHESKRKIIFLQSPILGEAFFDFLFFPPSKFIKIKAKYTFPINQNKINIGIHFRGTDFLTWNKNACLPFEYYKKAIDFCCNHYLNQSICFFLCTDDPKYSTFLKTKQYLQTKDLFFYYKENQHFIYDFSILSQCDTVISSPSTFAITASILGKNNKKIIHNQKWLEYTTNHNDHFWLKLQKTKNSYYSLWKSF